MAKIGLNYGEKLQIADKTYRVISEGLDIPQVFGKLTFRGIEGTDTIYEIDRSQRNPDGSYVQVNTGEIRGVVVGIHSSLLIWQSLKSKTWDSNTVRKSS